MSMYLSRSDETCEMPRTWPPDETARIITHEQVLRATLYYSGPPRMRGDETMIINTAGQQYGTDVPVCMPLSRPPEPPVIDVVPGMCEEPGRTPEYHGPERKWLKPGARRAPAPLWARVVLGAGLYLLGVLSGGSAVLAWAVAVIR